MLFSEIIKQEADRRARENALSAYKPYIKQLEFHAAGAIHRERLLMAGNQTGKTFSGAMELAMHLTGLYPSDWKGRIFQNPVRAWAASKSAEMTRDGVQKHLVGEPANERLWGTGAIPKACLADWSRRQGVANALDSCLVEHTSGGQSVLGFKSYDQGRERWQGETLHVVWFDEEPPLDIYIEGLTRTNATEGFVFMTFTPLLGMSEVVSMYMDECRVT
jgi:phage terminase large subunit-like protein